MLTNPKHEAFAKAVASGKSGAEAYRVHVSEGDCSNATAEVNSSKLLKDGTKVALRVSQLREKIEKKAEAKFDLTREKWLEMLLENAKEAKVLGEIAASTGALKEVGKAMPGWYAAEKVEHGISNDLAALIEEVRER